MIKFLLSAVASLASIGALPLAFAQSPAPTPTPNQGAEIVLAADVEWGPLNPARGDKGPRAGTLWGDRTGSGPSGFLVKFAQGFSSPPHIHNVGYRGVVIQGLVHNDDPDAGELWMPTGSFWAQPAGEAPITAAKANYNLAYIEIEEGPYLVQPTEQAFDSGARPVNVHESNLVWVDAADLAWIDTPDSSDNSKSPKSAFLWGNPGDGRLNGSLIKLPAGFNGQLRSRGSDLRAVLIQGRADHQSSGQSSGKAQRSHLTPGSYFGSAEESEHRISCTADVDCLLYLRVAGEYRIVGSPLSMQPQ